MPDVSTPGKDPSKIGKKLPAPDFCNKKDAGKKNPVYGKGALGNQFQSRMFYSGSDKEDHVALVQTMLSGPGLGYDVGPKGADGKFGDETEKAVKKFQKEHEDWHGDPLNVDGLVGPETADALNRAMVGADGWYETHQTETSLTLDFSLLTVTSNALKKPVSMSVENTEKGKIVIARKIPDNSDLLRIKLIDFDRQPMKNTHYRLELDDEAFSPVEADTDEQGVLSEPIPKSALTGRLKLEMITYKLLIVPHLDPTGEISGAIVRLSNLGYPVDIPDNYLQSQTIAEEPELLTKFENALAQFQMDNDLKPTGNLDSQTEKKLDDIYG